MLHPCRDNVSHLAAGFLFGGSVPARSVWLESCDPVWVPDVAILTCPALLISAPELPASFQISGSETFNLKSLVDVPLPPAETCRNDKSKHGLATVRGKNSFWETTCQRERHWRCTGSAPASGNFIKSMSVPPKRRNREETQLRLPLSGRWSVRHLRQQPTSHPEPIWNAAGPPPSSLHLTHFQLRDLPPPPFSH